MRRDLTRLGSVDPEAAAKSDERNAILAELDDCVVTT